MQKTTVKTRFLLLPELQMEPQPNTSFTLDIECDSQ